MYYAPQCSNTIRCWLVGRIFLELLTSRFLLVIYWCKSMGSPSTAYISSVGMFQDRLIAKPPLFDGSRFTSGRLDTFSDRAVLTYYDCVFISSTSIAPQVWRSYWTKATERERERERKGVTSGLRFWDVRTRHNQS